MRKAIAVGILLFLVFLIARAPAALIRLALDGNQPVTLVDLNGTIWAGDGSLLMAGMQIGRLNWSFQPGTLMRGRVGYDVALLGPDIDLDGQLSGLGRSGSATVSGHVGAPFVNRWLAPYDIELTGDFQLDEISITISEQRLDDAAGNLTWSGGPVTYFLSGKMYKSSLAPMQAPLGPGPVATAYLQGEQTPLLQAELKPDGFARIGVTKYLTRILGNPWPGSDPDHAVVLEVEEQVF